MQNDFLDKTLNDLAERNKELNCLYSISTILEQPLYSVEEVLQQIVNILPQGWKKPDDTCAQIVFKNQVFISDNFLKTEWQQICDLMLEGQPVGSVKIYRRAPSIEDKVTPFLKEEKDLLSAVASRLSKAIARLNMEAALKKSEQRFRDLIENSIAGISIVQNNQIVYQNQEQKKLLGPLPRTYVLGDYENIHPDDVKMVMQANKDIQLGKIPNLDLDFRLIQESSGKDNPVMKRIFGRAMRIEYHGNESILVNLIDMTHIMELEQLLFKQDKMASLGRVAAGIAHEIRNPLSGINIYLAALKKMVDKPGNLHKVDQIINQLKSASIKIESVIKKVMDFAKPGEPKFALIQLNMSVKDALNLTTATLRKSGIIIETDLDENLPACYADPNLIEVTILNLINNAADAMRNMETNKIITVSSKVIDDHICIKVSDSGPGVPNELKNKVFDPFFTTKNDGTGIGLSLCHRILSDHSGDLSVSKGELGGAEFRFEIPIKKDMSSSD